MSGFFGIEPDDIASLSDSDLRQLIGQLCEADFRRAGLSTAGILWGGNQDAADGGFDVVINIDTDPPTSSFVKRSRTGFQVKRPDMNASAIAAEMRPKGILRDAIKDLIKEAGSYIIVSSTGSTTATALQRRINAMREAVQDAPGHHILHIDFLDRGRVASWVREHPSLILWVRNRIGRGLSGWQPYENWAHSPGGLVDEYLFDDGLRLHDGTQRDDHAMSAGEGIQKLRSLLATPGTSVRLAGLSGVGKTRLVQALFDERIGSGALNKSQAFYTDVSDGPSPDPRAFAEQLIADRARAILVVDNCPPDLHRRLTPVCGKYGSAVSLITVEYDIREDLPDETSVFRLEPASEELIAALIERRYPHVSYVDAGKIAHFSGGNARLAIALANTVRAGQTLSGFRDDQLFERLFEQRKGTSANLLSSAEACSLVYSFDVREPESPESELGVLSSFTSRSSLVWDACVERVAVGRAQKSARPEGLARRSGRLNVWETRAPTRYSHAPGVTPGAKRSRPRGLRLFAARSPERDRAAPHNIALPVRPA